MTITAQKSTQRANDTASPPVKNVVIEDGKLRLAHFNFTQVGAGDIASTMDLVKFGAGRIRIIPALSWIKFSAWGAGATLNIGNTGYTKLDGTAVAAVVDNIVDDVSVATAGVAFLGTGTNAAGTADALDIESKGDLLIQAKVAGAVVPDGAIVNGWIAYVRD